MVFFLFEIFHHLELFMSKFFFNIHFFQLFKAYKDFIFKYYYYFKLFMASINHFDLFFNLSF